MYLCLSLHVVRLSIGICAKSLCILYLANKDSDSEIYIFELLMLYVYI